MILLRCVPLSFSIFWWFMLVLLLWATLLPVLANAAAGFNPSCRPHALMDGFGANFGLMIALLVMITVVSTVLVPVFGNLSQFLGLTNQLMSQLQDVIAIGAGGAARSFTLGDALLVVLTIFLSVWLFLSAMRGRSTWS